MKKEITMEKHATATFIDDNRDSQLRYIQKYYLPQELRDIIYPADIEGICRCFSDESELWNGCIPEKLPDCLVTYKDIGMDKHFDGETVRQIMSAYMAYHEECRMELTPEEELAAINLNHWLIEWEKQLLVRLVQISETMERQVRSGDSWLTDYEIEVTVRFYARDDDPFSYENTENFWKGEIECDSQLLCETSMIHRGPISAAEAAKDDYWGIGDTVDHNDYWRLYDEHERPERHCDTFHELYDHVDFPRKHMRRIGYVSTDIEVKHQNGISIDLSGVQPVAVMDEPRIRGHLILNKCTLPEPNANKQLRLERSLMMKNENVLSDDPICNRYLVQIEAFDDFLSDHLENFKGLDLFKPYVVHINKIRAFLEDCSEYIETFGDNDSEEDNDVGDSYICDYEELEDELKENSAEALADFLNTLPEITPGSFSASTPQKYIGMFSDIDDFFERYFDETIRKEGFKLYNVLLGAV